MSVTKTSNKKEYKGSTMFLMRDKNERMSILHNGKVRLAYTVWAG